jgi:hypothetical protein
LKNTENSDGLTSTNPYKIIILGSESNNVSPNFLFVQQCIDQGLDPFVRSLAGLRSVTVENLVKTSTLFPKLNELIASGRVVVEKAPPVTGTTSTADQFVQVSLYYPASSTPVNVCSVRGDSPNSSVGIPLNLIGNISSYQVNTTGNTVKALLLEINTLWVPDAFKIEVFDTNFITTKTIKIPLVATQFAYDPNLFTTIRPPFGTPYSYNYQQIFIRNYTKLAQGYGAYPTSELWTWNPVIHPEGVTMENKAADLKNKLLDYYPPPTPSISFPVNEIRNYINTDRFKTVTVPEEGFPSDPSNNLPPIPYPTFISDKSQFSRINTINQELITNNKIHITYANANPERNILAFINIYIRIDPNDRFVKITSYNPGGDTVFNRTVTCYSNINDIPLNIISLLGY